MNGDVVKEIAGLAERAATMQTIDGATFAYADLKQVRVLDAQPEPLVVHTLQAIADMYPPTKPPEDPSHPAYAHVVSPSRVEVWSDLHGAAQRSRFLVAERFEAKGSELVAAFQDPGSFVLMVLTKCVPSDDRAALLALVGNLSGQLEGTFSDDGVTQVVGTRKGVTLAKSEAVRNVYRLAPYRTFAEVVQPESSYVLRVRQSPGAAEQVEVGLFLSDGEAWQTEAVKTIGAWLRDKVALTVLA